MANVDAAFGLQLVEDNSHTPLETCFIPSTDGTAVFVGDTVKTAGSSGNIVGCPKKKTVAQCPTATAIYGVVQGFLPQMVSTGMDLSKRYRPANTAMYVLIKPANNQDIYRIQCDDVGSVIGDTEIGLNADIAVGSGSTITGMSHMELDSSTALSTATLQLKIIGFDDRTSNQTGVAKQEVLVRLNNIELSGGTGTAGV
jgi:hypothetical protein